MSGTGGVAAWVALHAVFLGTLVVRRLFRLFGGV